MAVFCSRSLLWGEMRCWEETLVSRLLIQRVVCMTYLFSQRDPSLFP